MGLCQSRAADGGGGIHASAHSTKRSVKTSSLISPSEKTSGTAPETPSCSFASPDFRHASPSVEDDLPVALALSSENYESAYTVTNENHSMNESAMESIFIEGDSLNGPSDEDDDILSVAVSLDNNNPRFHVQIDKVQQRHSFLRPPTRKSSPGGNPARHTNSTNSQNYIQQNVQLGSRTTTPGSILLRPAPLIAPPKKIDGDIPSAVIRPSSRPKAAVTPQTIANFNRLKIQVELAEKNELHRRRKAKLEDRVEDVKGYRSLWKDFKSIIQEVEGTITKGSDEHEASVKIMDLKETSSWYFDFRSLNSWNHLDSDEYVDNRTQTPVSLLSEVTMKTQRKYFDEKRSDRLKRRRDSHKHYSQDGVKNRSKDKPSARSVTSRGSALFLRGKTTGTVGDYGPAKAEDNSDVDMAHDLGSDDSTPITRTGREMGRTTSSHGENGTVVSDLDLDDYNVPRKRRTHRNRSDDSSVDTIDERSIEAGFSNVEFDMTNFLPRIRDDSGQPKQRDCTNDNTNVDRFPGTTEASATQFSHVACHYTPRSRIEQYGFDPSAPLSYQLELFADATTPNDATADRVPLSEFCGLDNRTPISARRLDGLFGKEDGTKKAENGTPEKIQPSFVDNVDRMSIETLLSDAQKQVMLDIAVAGKENNPAKRQLHLNTRTIQSFSPYDIMSPSQFMMMSSFHTTSRSSDGEEDSTEDKNESTYKAPEGEFECITCSIADESAQSGEGQKSSDMSSVLKLYDSNISTLSTEAFLRMSWHSRDLNED